MSSGTKKEDWRGGARLGAGAPTRPTTRLRLTVLNVNYVKLRRLADAAGEESLSGALDRILGGVIIAEKACLSELRECVSAARKSGLIT